MRDQCPSRFLFIIYSVHDSIHKYCIRHCSCFCCYVFRCLGHARIALTCRLLLPRCFTRCLGHTLTQCMRTLALIHTAVHTVHTHTHRVHTCCVHIYCVQPYVHNISAIAHIHTISLYIYIYMASVCWGLVSLRLLRISGVILSEPLLLFVCLFVCLLACLSLGL